MKLCTSSFVSELFKRYIYIYECNKVYLRTVVPGCCKLNPTINASQAQVAAFPHIRARQQAFALRTFVAAIDSTQICLSLFEIEAIAGYRW